LTENTGDILNVFIGILVTVIAFALMIFVHEFGHFFTAKLFKIKVNEFALGMGPSLFKFRKGETEYSLRLFPIGGYCAMEGEDGENSDPRAFVNQKPWKRLIVLGAGAFMNILLGLIIISILVSQMSLLGTRHIAITQDASSNSVFHDYDEILKVNGKHIFSATDIDYILALDTDGKADFLIRRDGEKLSLKDVELELINDKESGATGTARNFTIYGVEKTFFGVIKYGVMKTISTVRLVIYSFASLITGKVPVSQLSGPVAVTDTVIKSVSYGWEPILELIGMISVNLGVFNLLPIPALDGSRMLFVFIEMIFRRPVSRKWESWIHAIGFIVLMGLMALVFFKDIFTLFR